MPRWGPAPFCARDTQLIDGALAELPQLYVELHLELGRYGSASGQRVSGTRERATPVRLEVDALMRQLHWTLVTWHELTADAVGQTVRTALRQRAGVEVGAACKVLRGQLGVLLRLPPSAVIRAGVVVELDGVQAGLELLRVHARARALLGRHRYVQVREAPCERCGTYALTREAGAELTRCAECGHHTDEDGYLDWCRRLTGGA